MPCERAVGPFQLHYNDIIEGKFQILVMAITSASDAGMTQLLPWDSSKQHEEAYRWRLIKVMYCGGPVGQAVLVSRAGAPHSRKGEEGNYGETIRLSQATINVPSHLFIVH